MTALKNAKPIAKVQPRVKLWFESQGESVLCAGLAQMLSAIREAGSVKQAAQQVGRSYRFVWARIKEAEQALGAALVDSRVGGAGTGRSELTPLAEDLLADYAALQQEVFALVDGVFRQRVSATLRRHRRQ